jgi:mRNA interferase MazF
MYEQRDLVVLLFPHTDLTGTKLRPAIILSSHGRDHICCMVTSNPKAQGLKIDEMETGVLRKESWAKPHTLFTIDERVIRKRFGRVSKQFYATLTKQIIRQIS